ncbi:spore coat protein CotJB [Sporosalibacterium faouarense]|uniref:spore coat protein CotJB n=1 Tax=Sporosalibacterium faouarense TaxID=516123 RepID=UPI00141CB97A|nr:spore coat protein CotJB [Sporosalibacterium faouarense]MTI49727.1 spore coat protein CotJB [Bacillota bacterium]
MDKKQLKLLNELMEIGFSLVETNLYLDTHPTDERALRLHNTLSAQYQELEMMYTDLYGPLKATSMSQFPWRYIEEPWPWDIEYCGCNY